MKSKLRIIFVFFTIFFIKCEHKVEQYHDLKNIVKGSVIDQQNNPEIVTANPDTVSEIFKGKSVPASKPKISQQKGIIEFKSGTPRIITINQKNLKVNTLGKAGIQMPNKVLFVEQKKIFSQPELIPASTINKIDNTPYDMNFLDVEQGINTSDITSMLEDKRGNIWFASEGAGVSKYDGNSFLHYSTYRGISHLLVTCIVEDSKGNIWFGTNGGGACKYDGEAFTQITKKEGLINNLVLDIIEDKYGNIWFATRGGLCKYNGDSFLHFTENQGISNIWIHSIKEDRNGNIWLGTDNGTIIKYDGNSFTNYSEIEDVENHTIYSIVEDNNGNMWFASFGGGILKFNGKSFFQYTEKEGLSSNNVLDLLADKNGNLWIGTEDSGACKFDGKNFTHLTKNTGLKNNLVRSIMEDGSGKLWFGSYDGATIYYPKLFLKYTTEIGLIGDSISSIIEDKNGNIWFASNGHGLCKYDGNNYFYYTKKEGLNSNNILSLMEDIKGNIWIGSKDSGVNKFTGKSFIQLSETDGLSSNRIHSIIQSENGDIWLGTYGNGLNKYTGKTFIHYTKKSGLSNNYVWSVIEDDSSNIWICTRYAGANKFDGKTFTRYSKNAGLTENSIYSIFQDKTGNIWFGTMNIGIVKYDGKVFTRYSEEDGLSSNTVFSILEDNAGNLWLSTDKGLSYFEFISDTENKDKQIINITNFSKEDGLDDPDFLINSACLDSKNRLWWGATKGVTMLDMNKFVLPKKAPVIQLNTIDIEQSFIDYRKLSDAMKKGESVFIGENRNVNLNKVKYNKVDSFNNYPTNLSLPYYINNLTFRFSAIDWSAPHRIQYQYFIEGLDKEWRHVTKENSADYRNIPFGSYIFKLKSIGIANIWSETFEYPFIIHPPWWFAWWAYILYTVVLLFIIMIIFRLRTAQLKIRQTELENTIKERTAEIVTQKDEIEDKNEELKQQRDEIHDTLEQLKESQTQLIHSEKMASLGQLIAGIAHEVNTPLGAIKSSIGTITDTMKLTIEKLPELIRRLSEERLKDFIFLLDKSMENTDYYSSKEERSFRKNISSQLEEQGIEDAYTIADTLVDMGIRDEISPFIPLLRDKDVDMILEVGYNLTNQYKNSQNIKTAVDKAAKVVFALKNYARYGETETKIKANIIEGIETVLTLYHNQLKQGVEVIKQFEDVPDIPCYPDELNQVWTNLIHNSIYAMNFKGKLEIKVEKTNSHVIVKIKDSGVGISKEVGYKIFEAFYTTKPIGEGSGLGLDIVQKIIEKHEGKIEFESKPGKWTEFTVQLPIK